ncbi:hypothetical protein ACN27G_13150 [Plantactinospora sp. WMMB334]|uniref:hypothetical protein n=1 Tax=Plantactinospora sp. WMMB334 TaxID=3404119 RepID=UPI003B933ACD
MSFHLILARTAVAALAGLMAMAPWTPMAVAARPPERVDTPPLTLVPAPCATGEITYSAGGLQPGNRHLALEGWIEPCVEPERPAGFSVMLYYTTYAAPYFFTSDGPYHVPVPGRRYPYDPVTLRTQFTFDFVWSSGALLRALCVARSVDAPVACVAVELPEDVYFSRRFSPIPVDDSRITSVPVRLDNSGGPGGNPACGNCV